MSCGEQARLRVTACLCGDVPSDRRLRFPFPLREQSAKKMLPITESSLSNAIQSGFLLPRGSHRHAPGCAFRHFSAELSRPRPVNACRVPLRAISHSGATHVRARPFFTCFVLLLRGLYAPRLRRIPPPERSTEPCSTLPANASRGHPLCSSIPRRHARYTAKSDAEGRFAFEQLPPGDYSARAEAAGNVAPSHASTAR